MCERLESNAYKVVEVKEKMYQTKIQLVELDHIIQNIISKPIHLKQSYEYNFKRDFKYKKQRHLDFPFHFGGTFFRYSFNSLDKSATFC